MRHQHNLKSHPLEIASRLEVGNLFNVRELVYIDVHSGKFVDQLPDIIDAMNRRAYDGMNLPMKLHFHVIDSPWGEAPQQKL